MTSPAESRHNPKIGDVLRAPECYGKQVLFIVRELSDLILGDRVVTLELLNSSGPCIQPGVQSDIFFTGCIKRYQSKMFTTKAGTNSYGSYAWQEVSGLEALAAVAEG